MSKAILIIDMPSSCGKCEFCRETGEGRHVCEQTVYKGRCKRIDYEVENYMYEKPTCCPLREVPKKRRTIGKISENDQLCINVGYNACIDEILGVESDD